MCMLLMYWSRLEYRTKNVIDLLRFAAEDKCVNSEDRKIRDKRKKAGVTLNDLLQRNSLDNAYDAIYEPIQNINH